jgi:hypothetical protein
MGRYRISRRRGEVEVIDVGALRLKRDRGWRRGAMPFPCPTISVLPRAHNNY